LQKFIKSGSKSFDKFIGGGFQPGYPWLFVADTEGEGITVSAICALSFNFVARGYPTLIMPTRHSWNVSMRNYRRTIPKTAEKLERAAREKKLLVANLFTTPTYKPVSDSEIYFDSRLYPAQINWEITKRLEELETGGKFIFWRLTSLSDLVRSWAEEKVVDAFGPLLAWLHGKGAVGVTTLNRELVSEPLTKWAVSLFPNVAYVETDPKKKVPHHIRIAKSINPRVSYTTRGFRLTTTYRISIG
jgi:hypothetical protein